MALKEDFETASIEVKQLSALPSNDNLLALYSYYKQATEGDVKGSRPGILDLKGRKKYDAWAEKKGMSSDQAMQSYVALVRKLQGK